MLQKCGEKHFFYLIVKQKMQINFPYAQKSHLLSTSTVVLLCLVYQKAAATSAA